MSLSVPEEALKLKKELEEKLKTEPLKRKEIEKALENMNICINAIELNSRRHLEVLLPKEINRARSVLQKT
jgi:hypothetical protein